VALGLARADQRHPVVYRGVMQQQIEVTVSEDLFTVRHQRKTERGAWEDVTVVSFPFSLLGSLCSSAKVKLEFEKLARR
jgi:hypothetical protein